MTLHLCVIPTFLSHRYDKHPSESGSFYWQQAAIVQHYCGWTARLLFPKPYSILRNGIHNWHTDITTDTTPEGIDVWRGYRPYLIPQRYRHTRILLHQLFDRYCATYGTPHLFWLQSTNQNHPITAATFQLSQRYNIPFFAIEHTDIYRLKKDRYANHTLSANALFLATVSAHMRAKLDHLTPNPPPTSPPLDILHNPVPEAFATPHPAPRKHDNFTFCNVGYLRQDKNQHLLIEAFAHFHARTPKSHLLLIGDGPNKQTLLQHIARHKMTNHVTLSGYVKDQAKLRQLMEQAHVFITATSHETFHLALVEALSCGLPCITTPYGIAPEVITNHNGIIIASPDSSLLYDSLCRVYDRYHHYDAPTIRKHALESFAPSRFASRLQALLRHNGFQV
ncbi:MAG: glycosyltransferase [Alphaproteobacteria bacterium GM202ARS2]|nr:glycosyltransferase [Alphaproteobacteria bacterium GM202ARS2]